MAWGAGGVLLFALLIRLIGITTTEVWPDEGVTLMLIRASWWDLLTRLPLATDHPPLSFVVFKIWSLVFHSEWTLRLLPVLLGVCAVGVLMRVAGRIHPQAAIPTGLLAAVSPIPVHYSQELRGYSLLFLLSALALLAAQRLAAGGVSHSRPGGLDAREGGQDARPSTDACSPREACPPRSAARRISLDGLLLAGAGAAAAHTHAVGLFVFPMAAVFLLVMKGRAGVRTLLRPGGVWLWFLLVGPMIWFNLHWSEVHRQDWWIPGHSWPQMRSYAEEYFGLMLLRRWEGEQIPRPVWTAYALQRLLMLGLAVLALAALAERRLRRPCAAFALAAGAYVGAMLLAGLVAVPNMLPRTLLPGWAPILVLLGLGGAGRVGRFHRLLPGGALGLLVCLYGAGWIWYVEAGPPRRASTRALYSWIQGQLGPHDVVVASRNCEDVTAYYLGHAVPGERLLSKSSPRFKALPAALRMDPPALDRSWKDRLSAALATAAEASGGRYSVWLIQYSLETDPHPPSLSEFLDEQHLPAGEFLSENIAFPRAVRYVPRRP